VKKIPWDFTTYLWIYTCIMASSDITRGILMGRHFSKFGIGMGR
jgi:hypothetical protein